MHKRFHVLLALLTGVLLYGEITVRQCPQMTSTIAVPGEYSQTFDITNTDGTPADIQLEMTVRQHDMYNSHPSAEEPSRIVVRKTIRAHATDTITAAKTILPMKSFQDYSCQGKIQFDYALSIHAIVRANGKKLYETSHNDVSADLYVSGTYHSNGKYCLVSRKLADKLWRQEKLPDEVIVAAVSPSQWSPRPTAYVAYSMVMLEQQEELPQAVTDALLLYVSQGGTLVYQTDNQQRIERHGLGTIIHIAQNAEQLIHKGDSSVAWQHHEGHRSSPMPDYPRPPIRLYAVFLVIAILLLGPGIWFWMSWRKKPLHSLWMTPLFSIIACLITLGIAIYNQGTSVRGTVNAIGFYDQVTGILTYDATISTYIPMGNTELQLHNDDLVGMKGKAMEETLCDASGKHVNGAVRSREVSGYWVQGWRDLSAAQPPLLLELKRDNDTLTATNLSSLNFSQIVVQDGQDYFAYIATGQHQTVAAGKTVVLQPGGTSDRKLKSGYFKIILEDQQLFGDGSGLTFDTIKGTQTLYGRWK